MPFVINSVFNGVGNEQENGKGIDYGGRPEFYAVISACGFDLSIHVLACGAMLCTIGPGRNANVMKKLIGVPDPVS
jgi:hypothetical protein